jgi:hypothetical protein
MLNSLLTLEEAVMLQTVSLESGHLHAAIVVEPDV